MQECDIHAVWEGIMYFHDKILPNVKTVLDQMSRPITQVCGERSQEISSPLNQTLAWRFCCLLSLKTETNLTGFDYGWKCIKTHYCLGHSKWKTGRIWWFHKTGSEKVKCLQMWTLNQMGLALNLGCYLIAVWLWASEVTSLSFSILVYKIWIKSIFFINVLWELN